MLVHATHWAPAPLWGAQSARPAKVRAEGRRPQPGIRASTAQQLAGAHRQAPWHPCVFVSAHAHAWRGASGTHACMLACPDLRPNDVAFDASPGRLAGKKLPYQVTERETVGPGACMRVCGRAAARVVVRAGRPVYRRVCACVRTWM